MKVVNKRFDKLSEWVTIVSKEVECGQKNEIYHSLIQKDYISALVLTNDNKIALVKQYRPAMEEFTYELPGGLLENSEDPADAMIRELYEETALNCDKKDVILLNKLKPDTGRLENNLWAFFIKNAYISHDLDNNIEEGIEVIYVTVDELFNLIKEGKFNHGLHLAIIGLCKIYELI